MTATVARWAKSEPVRLLVYLALSAIVGTLAVRGYVNADLGDAIVGALALVLGIPAAEFARRRVTAPANLPAVTADVVDDLLSAAAPTISNQFGEPGRQVLQQIQERTEALRGDTSGRTKP
ncbi:hypothetical protein C5E45_32690 [Nocardia nova]|uniref:Uncharacterized protein n=1 Tax=Nocardia nova TaxID=37330 RepID=A0A2S6ACU0_9NOCA|nr:hypothetical protein [Nocardia nova]PPJ31850.1 hypothetical protein C5E45_32690 [Nocardia nova]